MTQDQAFDLLRFGNNIFLTGAAGSGKSFLLRRYIAYCKKQGITVAVTAATGIAAVQIDGRTIHSWSGIGIHDDMTEKEIARLQYNDDLRERVTKTKTLIVDEISMLGAHTLDLIDRVCRQLRESTKPFGGMQVILCGDFFQLPPIHNRDSATRTEFAFASHAWEAGAFLTCYLEKQYRQTDDEYLTLLNGIRHCNVTETLLEMLFSRRDQPVRRVKKPTKLYTHNVDVDAINTEELSLLDEELMRFEMRVTGEPNLITHLKKNCLVPETLELKKGAVVMFAQNNPYKGYVNGTLGTVIGFDPDDSYPVVKTVTGKEIVAKPGSWAIEDDDDVLAEIAQVPLRLAWAITVHKSQGMSLDAAEIDLSRAFTEGMGYVALSRVRTLAGLSLVGLNEMALRVNPEITALDGAFQSESKKNVAALKRIKAKEKKLRIKEFVRLNT